MLYGLNQWREYLNSAAGYAQLAGLYPGGGERQRARYLKLLDGFEDTFGGDGAAILSAPGRTELIGNHTDHQRGRVLAAAVTMDKIAAAAPNGTGLIRVMTPGFGMDTADVSELESNPSERNTSQAIIRGIAAGFKTKGFDIGGFDAYISSDVPPGSGLSSSAAFEVLIAEIINRLFNAGKTSPVQIAQISQYAENEYFGKPCGLMDQLASSVGGVVAIDFANPKTPVIEKIDGDLLTGNFRICIINAGGSHANLTPEYAAIPGEMGAVAQFFGKDVLREVEPYEFYASLSKLRAAVSDRAILRAMHFFAEDARVSKQADALRRGDIDAYRELMLDSGRSSYTRLQNIHPALDDGERSVALALAVSEELLAKDGGAWRVHGGGFAGTIQALVPVTVLETYHEKMESLFGSDCCFELSIRPVGGIAMDIG